MHGLLLTELVQVKNVGKRWCDWSRANRRWQREQSGRSRRQALLRAGARRGKPATAPRCGGSRATASEGVRCAALRVQGGASSRRPGAALWRPCVLYSTTRLPPSHSSPIPLPSDPVPAFRKSCVVPFAPAQLSALPLVAPALLPVPGCPHQWLSPSMVVPINGCPHQWLSPSILRSMVVPINGCPHQS